jgi:Cdc6-like AAA superfamily ATPase
MDAVERQRLSLEVGGVFTPATPVNEEALFAGRWKQVTKVIDAIRQTGQHAIIYGERGVGKTSLANVLSAKLRAPSTKIIAPRVNCDSLDGFKTLWMKIFSEMELIRKIPVAGMTADHILESVSASEALGEDASPDDVRKLLTLMASKGLVIIIIDEFDRLVDQIARRAVADTIKALSDYAVEATLVLIGVGDTVDNLIADHQSIERALVQIPMPRMSSQEIREILQKGMERLGMAMIDDAKNEICILAQGLPHYAHLLGLHATRQAIEQDELTVTCDHIQEAVKAAVDNAQQSLRSAYRQAVISPRKNTIYAEVLLACALAKTDDFGFFSAADVREPLSTIMRKQYEISYFAKHVNHFCLEDGGSIIQKTGVKHKFRFRFANPLMPPLIVMQGLVSKKINRGTLEQLKIARASLF